MGASVEGRVIAETGSDDDIARPAWLMVKVYRSSTPGLVVHPAGGSPAWTVTHNPSGLTLGWYFRSKDAALRFAEALDGATDWTRGRLDKNTRSGEEIDYTPLNFAAETPELGAVVTAAARAAGGQKPD